MRAYSFSCATRPEAEEFGTANLGTSAVIATQFSSEEYVSTLQINSLAALLDLGLQLQRVRRERTTVLHYAVVFFILALVAAFFGFAGVAGAAAGIAKILFFVFLVVFVISLLMGRRTV